MGLEKEVLLQGANALREQADRLEFLASNPNETIGPKRDIDDLLTVIRSLPSEDFIHVLHSVMDHASVIFIEPAYITIKEASRLKHLSTTRIKELAEQGILEGSTKINNVWHIPRISVDNHNPPGRGRPKRK